MNTNLKFKILLIAIVIVGITVNITSVSSNQNYQIFDAVSILEYLSGEKNLTEVSDLDFNCNCEITLRDAFIVMQNQLTEETYNNCDLCFNRDASSYVKKMNDFVDNVIKANEKIKNYTYKGNWIGNSTGSANGTAEGNYTIYFFGIPVTTYSFSNEPFNASFNLISNGTYNGTYERINNSGYIDGNVTTRIDGTVSVKVITQPVNETNTTEVHNETNNADIYNNSVAVLKDNETEINIVGIEMVDGTDCYKILAVPSKNKSAEILKNMIKSYEDNYTISLNLNESNIKELNITYWISKDNPDNFTILQEHLNAKIENFTQKINKTNEVNQCKDNACIKNVTLDTLNITQMNISVFIKFTEIYY